MMLRRFHHPRRLVAALASFTMAISGLLLVMVAPAGAAPFVSPACGISSTRPQAVGTNRVNAHGVGATKSGAVTLNPGLALAFTPPTGELTVPYTAQPTATGGLPPYDWDLVAGTLPAGLSFNFATGRISGTPTAAGTTSVSIEVTDDNFDSVTLARTITIVATPTLSGSLLGGEVTAPYSSGFTVSGGVGPFVWTITSGTLPTGLTLSSSTGSITGTPTAVTSCSSFGVRVTDANTRTASRAGAITVLAGPTAAFTSASGEVGASYTAQPSATGGTTPYTWAVSAGSLPNGLSINTTSGAISGTPTAAGTTAFTVQATDAKGGKATKAASIAIIAGPSVTFMPSAGEATVAYSAQPTATGGTSPYTWSVSTGTLPSGLSISPSTGLIAGTPTTAGTTNVTVRATDNIGVTATQARDITIVATPTLTGALPDGELTAPYNSGFAINDGIGPFVWTINSGTLPAGLTLDTSTGLITGTPTSTGSSTITVLVTDANNLTTTRSATIAVTAGPAVTFTPPNGEVGVSYTAQPTATGGTGSYTWAVSAGSLPAGLSINATTGAISGTPTTAGTSNVTVQATDNIGGTATQARDIAVVAAPTLTGTLSDGELTAPYSSRYTLSDGVGPFAWSISSGTLPAGLSVNTSTGLITGTSTVSGSSTITVQVADANNRTATRSGTITVIAGPVVAFTPPTGEVAVFYSAQPTVSGGTGPYTWAVSAGTLPDGLSIDANTGAITGGTFAAGTTNVTIQATDASGGTGTVASSITIVPEPALTGALTTGEVGRPYSSWYTLSGGIGPYVWEISSGTLPAGLTLDTSTGLITGTPTATNNKVMTVSVTDANDQSATSVSRVLRVVAAPVAAFTPPTGEVGVAYTAQATASGGVGSYTWAVSAGTLPAGLSINASNGRITGRPTAAGSADITVRVTDATGGTATKAGTITIVAAPSLTFTAPPAGDLGAAYRDQLTKSGGVGTVTWSLSLGSLPAGLTLDNTGLISGTPTASGSFDFTVKIVDNNGVSDTKAATVAIAKTTTTVSVSGPASVQFGTSVTLTASVTPTAAGGTVTFTDVPATGPDAGSAVDLASPTLVNGAASVDVTLPAFGVNKITAHYSGDSAHAAADSSMTQVEVSAYAGELIVSEFRSSGPIGQHDSYVELLNTGPPVPLAGVVVSFTSGTDTTLPVNAGLLGTGRSYLITDEDFSLGAIATSDYSTTLGTGGFKVVAPDTANTQTDAVGPTSGFHLGTGLPAMTGTTAQYAWVRREIAGAAINTHDNLNDFVLVSSSIALVGGVQPVLGSASPTGTADPFQTNAGMTSTLYNPTVDASLPPNRIILTGPPRQLVIQRTITNTSGATITSAKVRVTALSEQFGPPEPGVPSQPARVAQLRAVNPIVVPGALRPNNAPVTKLTIDLPITNALGGGLNSTLTLPLPNGGLAPGDSVRVAFTFDIDTRGTFWFGYDVDAITGSTAGARSAHPSASRAAHVSPRVRGKVKSGDAGRIG